MSICLLCLLCFFAAGYVSMRTAEGNFCGDRHRFTMIEPTPLIRETEVV